jgi:DNA-binding transcriptional LysR family regulator
MNTLHYFHVALHLMHDALHRLDLNLLLVFDALHRRGSVAGAADELALSPSACSHALARLRLALNDELFLRYGSAMQPTAFAQSVASDVSECLGRLSQLLTGAAPFDPATSNQTFAVAATDFTAFALLPVLVAKLEKAAPQVSLKVTYATHRDSLDELSAGRVQFVLGFSEGEATPTDGIESLRCEREEYVVVSRKDHPRIRRKLSMEQYLHERHVVVVPWSNSRSVIDAALALQGYRRDVAVELPSVMSAPFIVAESDLLLTLPRRAAERLSNSTHLVQHKVPFDAPTYELEISYHLRHAGSTAHRWMRDLMAKALGAMSATRQPADWQ